MALCFTKFILTYDSNNSGQQELKLNFETNFYGTYKKKKKNTSKAKDFDLKTTTYPLSFLNLSTSHKRIF